MKKILGIDFDIESEKLSDAAYLAFFQMKLLSMVFGVVSLVIAIMNAMTNSFVSVLVALSFFLVSCVNYAVMQHRKRVAKLNYIVFDISVVLLFAYFTLTGGDSVFDDVWVMLLPVCSISFLGRRHGIILSSVMLLIIVLVFWFPAVLPIDLYNYSQEFRICFPIAYIAFTAVGYSLEMLRLTIINSLLHSRTTLLYTIEHDALTGLKNRHWFNEKFCKDYDQFSLPYDCIAMIIDIDNFKKINDTYGHLEGDAVICSVAGSINEQLAKDSVLCRWGGDEFFAFIPNCTSEKAEKICDRIRETVRKRISFNENLSDETVTVSIGVVKVLQGDKIDIEKILNKADMRMYKAKANGKDASCLN